MAGTEQTKSSTKNKRGGGLSLPLNGGGGILLVGGSLIALGAAFLFRRSRANKRRLPPPPTPPPLPNQADEINGKAANDAAKGFDGGDPRIGLQSILLPIHQESQDLAVAADRSVYEIGQTTVIEADVVEKIEFKDVEEVEEKDDEEGHETLTMESEEEAPELSVDETGSSSVESSPAAVWPADMMEQEEQEEEEESPAMEMKESAMDCVPELMKLQANKEIFDAMPVMKMSEKKKKHYKGFILLLALLVAFGLLCCKVATSPKIH